MFDVLDGQVDTTGMAVIIDLGEADHRVHPRNKTEVGRRMALQLLHVALGLQQPEVLICDREQILVSYFICVPGKFLWSKFGQSYSDVTVSFYIIVRCVCV